ncbi:MAG TPA: sialidase family protein [Burkholderiales bacterium]|nr:sialidase family protein [Burkholderiales bacterium]
MSPRLRWTSLAAILLVFAALVLRALEAPPPARFVGPRPVAEAPSSAPSYRSQLLPNGSAQVHSATAVELADGRLRAFWYGGTREGAQDVAIYTSVYSPKDASWSPERAVMTRELAQRQLRRYVRKLGNPVAGRDPAGRIWLFFVSVSVGGWAGSAVNAVVSTDEGTSWSPPRRLISSPFFNISTLVKGVPLPLSDGTTALPAYHEFLGKFGELLRVDGDGRVIGKTRLSWGKSSLQPVIVPRSGTEAVAFMRYAGGRPARVLVTRTNDAGAHWSEPAKTSLPNPDAAVGGVLLAGGPLVLAFNNAEENREDLSLAVSGDFGASWRVARSLEGASLPPPHAPVPEYSYPWIMQDRAGDVHVLYTWGRTRIKHAVFNRAWLEGGR